MILGARRSELCALRWSHVDFDHGEILIERGVTYVPGVHLVDADTKDHGKRRFAADPHSMELLRAHRVACAKVALELGASLPTDAYVFSYAAEGSAPMHPTVPPTCSSGWPASTAWTSGAASMTCGTSW